MIEGFSRNGCFSEVLSAFKWMLVDGNAAATRVNVFSACARLGVLDLGKYMRMQIVMDTGEMYMLGIL